MVGGFVGAAASRVRLVGLRRYCVCVCVCVYVLCACASVCVCGVILLIRAARESKSDASASTVTLGAQAAVHKNSRRAPRHNSYSVPSCNRNKKANALCTRGARELSAGAQRCN